MLDDFKKGQRLTAEWVDNVNRELAKLKRINGAGGIRVSNTPGSINISYTGDAAETTRLYGRNQTGGILPNRYGIFTAKGPASDAHILGINPGFGGTFALRYKAFDGSTVDTGDINYNDDNSTVQTVIDAASIPASGGGSITCGVVSVSGNSIALDVGNLYILYSEDITPPVVLIGGSPASLVYGGVHIFPDLRHWGGTSQDYIALNIGPLVLPYTPCVAEQFGGQWHIVDGGQSTIALNIEEGTGTNEFYKGSVIAITEAFDNPPKTNDSVIGTNSGIKIWAGNLSGSEELVIGNTYLAQWIDSEYYINGRTAEAGYVYVDSD